MFRLGTLGCWTMEYSGTRAIRTPGQYLLLLGRQAVAEAPEALVRDRARLARAAQQNRRRVLEWPLTCTPDATSPHSHWFHLDKPRGGGR